MRAQQVAHLPAVPHFLDHHALQGQEVVVRRRVLEQVALLFHGGELGVSLVDDQIQQGITNALVGDVHHGRPFPLAAVMAGLDVRSLRLTELGVELEFPQRSGWQADRILPVAEVVDPVIEVVELPDHSQRLRVASDASMRWRASGVANSSCCMAISWSSISSSVAWALL